MDSRALSVTALALFLSAAISPSNNNVPQKAGPQGQNGVTMLRTSTQLVYVDVIVHDKNGNPVHGLTAADFALLENGRSQNFKGFEEHTAPTAQQMEQAQVVAQRAKLHPGTFSNFAAAQFEGPLNVVLIDRLNTSVADQLQMVKQINEYLDHAPRGQRMAVFELTDQLNLRQGFTDDFHAIRTALESKSLSRSPLLGVPSSAQFKAGQLTGDDGDASRGPTSTMDDNDKQTSAYQLELRRKISLHALNGMARYLATMPGRKNVLWFSGSFPTVMMMALDVPGIKASAEREFHETTALLSQSQAAMYPIDSKGIIQPSNFTAEDNGCGSCNVLNPLGHIGAVMANIQNNIDSHNETDFGEHQTMYEVASDTGGKAFINTNDFADAMGKALTDGSEYYSIMYAPSDTNWDGRYRHISVKLKEKGYTLSYRRGYFAIKLEGAGGPDTVGSKPMQVALTHGAPLPTQLLFSTKVQPVNAATEDDIAAHNRLEKGVAGPFRRYRLDYAIDPRAIRFTQGKDGVRHETVEFIAYVYDHNGKPLNSIADSIKTSVTAAEYARFQQIGLPFRQEISVPAKGEFSIRIAMHDVEANTVGAVEVPVNAVSGLPTVETSAEMK